MMSRIDLLRLSPILVLAFCVSCTSLNYPEPEPEPGWEEKAVYQPPRARAARPVAGEESALAWSDLTRLAREHRQQGEYEEARERLSQAALQVSALPPTNAQRRTVLGMQARLAEDMAERGDIEAADLLADELFEQVEAEPDVGGTALISLALSTAERREAAALEAGEEDAQLALLRLALDTAERRSTSRDRMELGALVADKAYRGGDLLLARRAIDVAVEDAQRVIPTRKARIAELESERARIALAQGDLVAAASAATTANQLNAEAEVESARQGVGEALLAEILAEQGELERARLIALGAYARVDGDDTITPHDRRRIVAGMARVDRASGEFASARRHFEEALEIEGLDLDGDRNLVRTLAGELQELDSLESSSLMAPTLE